MQGDAETWAGDIVHTSQPKQDAETVRSDRQRPAFTVTVGNVDLPAYISNGVVYIQAPLPHVFEAFAEDLSAFISDLEIRISDAWGTALSLASDGRALPCKAVAEPSMVRGRGKS